MTGRAEDRLEAAADLAGAAEEQKRAHGPMIALTRGERSASGVEEDVITIARPLPERRYRRRARGISAGLVYELSKGLMV
jgi:hypothetical protein